MIWESLACRGPVLSQFLISLQACGRLVGEVLRAVGDLLAGEGQERPDEREAGEHDQRSRDSPRGSPIRCRRSTTGTTSAEMSSATASGIATTAKNATSQSTT